MAVRTDGPSRPPVTWKLATASIIGNTIEFYDFTIYATLTALVFTRLFFPAHDPLVGTLLSFGAFAAGFLARPIGGIVFGHFGDRLGRRNTLMWSLGVMGVATFLIGLLPTYASVGVTAPILLTVLRVVQGFGIGGEWGGAVSLMVESAPPRRRGLYGSLVQTGSGLGIILSSLTVSALLAFCTPAQLLAWGWRVPFLVSLVLVGVGVVVRWQISESPAFRATAGRARAVKVPLWETLRRHPRNVLVATGLHVSDAAFGFLMGVFTISYVTNQLHLPNKIAVDMNLVGAVFYLVATVVGGAVSDRVGRRRAYLVFAALMIPAVFVFFWLLGLGSVPLLFVAGALAQTVLGLVYGIQAAFFSELFSTEVRYSGISLGFQLATVLGGALMPTIASLLIASSGGATWSVSVYITVLVVITLVATLAAKTVPVDGPRGAHHRTEEATP
ncbi:MAG TPA: MFS transporter [Streptosporangiaceae bacterium]